MFTRQTRHLQSSMTLPRILSNYFYSDLSGGCQVLRLLCSVPVPVRQLSFYRSASYPTMKEVKQGERIFIVLPDPGTSFHVALAFGTV